MTPVQIEGVAATTIEAVAPIFLKFAAANPNVQVALMATEALLIALQNAQAAGILKPDQGMLAVENAVANVLGVHNAAVASPAAAAVEPAAR